MRQIKNIKTSISQLLSHLHSLHSSISQAIFLEHVTAMRLLGTRATQYLSLFSLPILVKVLKDYLEREKKAEALVIAFIFISAPIFSSIIYSVGMFGIMIHYVATLRSDSLVKSLLERAGMFLIFVSFVKSFAYLMPNKLHQLILLSLLLAFYEISKRTTGKLYSTIKFTLYFAIFSPLVHFIFVSFNGQLTFEIIVPSAALLLCLLTLSAEKFNKKSFPLALLIIGVFSLSLYKKNHEGIRQTSHKYKAFYDVQTWVNKNTSPTSGFSYN